MQLGLSVNVHNYKCTLIHRKLLIGNYLMSYLALAKAFVEFMFFLFLR